MTLHIAVQRKEIRMSGVRSSPKHKSEDIKIALRL